MAGRDGSGSEVMNGWWRRWKWHTLFLGGV